MLKPQVFAKARVDADRLGVALSLIVGCLDHIDTLINMNNLALSYQAVGKLDQALPLFEESLKRMKATLGPDHPDTLVTKTHLGTAYCVAKQGEKAAPLLKEFIAARRMRASKDDARFAGLLAQVALGLLKCDQFAVAEEMLRESLALRGQMQLEAWTRFNTQSLLGGALLGQKKYAEAKPWLLMGYAGMKGYVEKTPGADAAELAIQKRLSEALDRLIQLYTETNKPDDVKKWQAEKEKLPKASEKK